jgi:hypothetical protein
MNSRLLTLARIQELQACRLHEIAFREVFGEQVEVTVECFSRPDVLEANFDYDWGVYHLLPEEQHAAYYAELRAEKDKIKTERGLASSAQIPWEERRKLAAVLWADFYVKYGLDQAPMLPIVREQTYQDEDLIGGQLDG